MVKRDNFGRPTAVPMDSPRPIERDIVIKRGRVDLNSCDNSFGGFHKGGMMNVIAIAIGGRIKNKKRV